MNKYTARKLILLVIAIALVLLIVNKLNIFGNKKKDDEIIATPAVTVTPSPSYETTNDVTPFFSTQQVRASYVPITIDNVADFSSGWVIGSTDGGANGNFEYENKYIGITYSGQNLEALNINRAGIPLTKGSNYNLFFTANCTINRKINVRFVNSDTGSLIASQSFDLSSTDSSYQMNIDMNSASTYNATLYFDIGNDGSDATKDYHDMTITAIRLINTSDNPTYSVRVNQIGYTTSNQKRCVFPYNEGDVFDVIDERTGSVVYSGAIIKQTQNPATGETDYIGDFTNLVTPGSYYIRSQIGEISYPFIIENEPYNYMLSDLIKMLSLQRCGSDLDQSWAGDMYHAQCHTSLANLTSYELQVDVTGGWHDAGDFGRYVKTGTKAVSDLLFSYLYNPNIFNDSAGIAESGNGTADILDEARYELEWLLKMQDSGGGVYSRVLTDGLPGTIDPSTDNQNLNLIDIQTTDTADFAGTMAVAYLTYQDIDKDFANKCLDASKKAWEFLEANPDLIEVINPDTITGGNYPDNNDKDERFYASIALYVATGENSYLDKAKEFFNLDSNSATGVQWRYVGTYGKYLYLKMADGTDTEFYNAMLESLKKEAANILNIVSNDIYNTSITSYVWGSNGIISDNGLILSMAYDITNDLSYQEAAIEQVNYILGKNTLNLCFVSGYGSNYPVNVHSRLAYNRQTILKGALVGGANGSLEDDVTEQMTTIPQAKVYADQYGSYSTNEISIYWNSSLIHLLSRISSDH